MTPKQLLSIVLGAMASALPAQAFAAREAELDRAAVSALLGFARAAEAGKDGPRARAAYERILDLHDIENVAARTALGYRKERGEWRAAPAGFDAKFVDASTYAARKKVMDAWRIVATKLGSLHRQLGLDMIAQDEFVRGRFHLEQALYYLPGDQDVHRALGHGSHGDFFGDDDEIAFVRRTEAIRQRVQELVKTKFPVERLSASEKPEPLPRMDWALVGARSENFAIWCRGTGDEAIELAQWAERALELLQFLLGEERSRQHRVLARSHDRKWVVRLRSAAERDRLFLASPAVFGVKRLEDVQRWGGHYVTLGDMPSYLGQGVQEDDADWIIAHVAMTCFSSGANDALGEGLVHAMTWLLVGTTRTWYGALPGTESSGAPQLTWHPGDWLELLRAQIQKGEDWPLEQLPRERLSRFRPQVRIKSWQFVLWLLGRHEEQWAALFHAFPTDRVPLPEEVAATVQQVLGRSVAEIEAEWRQWVSGTSPIAKAARY